MTFFGAALAASVAGSLVAIGLLGLAALVGLALAGWGLRQCWFAVRIARTDPTSIRSVGSGPVEIAGTARVLDRQVRGPFTGTPCLACEYEVQELQHSGKHSYWDDVARGSGRVPFLVEDDTASMVVEPDGATLSLRAETTRVRGDERPPERIRQFIEDRPDVDSEERSIDVLGLEIDVGADRKYVERRLDPGETVHVYGEAVSDPSATNAVGSIGRVIRAGNRAPFFRITDGSEHDAARRLAWRGVPAALAGLALLGVAGLYLWGVLAG